MMRLFSTNLLLLLVVPATVTGRAILGVDLGSLYMKVALVKSGSPLEIVTNLHSKRKTEQMILFDQSQRLYGADASALLARKSHQTPAAMSLMLGRDEQHPVVQVCIYIFLSYFDNAQYSFVFGTLVLFVTLYPLKTAWGIAIEVLCFFLNF